MKLLSKKFENLINELNSYNKIVKKTYQNGGTSDFTNVSKDVLDETVKRAIIYKQIADKHINSLENIYDMYDGVTLKLENVKNNIKKINRDVLDSEIINNNLIKLNIIDGLSNTIQESKKKQQIKDASKSNNVTKVSYDLYRVGGAGATQGDVASLISEMNTIDSKADDNNKSFVFVTDKMKSMQERMAKIVDDANGIYKLRSEIEWLVNKLEELGEDSDKKEVEINLDALKKVVESIKTKMSESEQKYDGVATYVSGLEKYISTMEAFLASSKQTISGLSNANVTEKDAVMTAMVGGARKKRQYGGDNIESKYNAIMKTKTDDLVRRQFYNNTTPSNINDSELYGQYVALAIMYDNCAKVKIEIVDKILTIVNTTNIDAFEKIWNITFSKKKTDFYTNLFTANKSTIPTLATYTNVSGGSTSDDDIIKNIIEQKQKLSNYFMWWICVYYVLSRFNITLESLTGLTITEETMNDIRTLGKNLSKDNFFTFKHFGEIYDNKSDPLELYYPIKFIQDKLQFDKLFAYMSTSATTPPPASAVLIADQLNEIGVLMLVKMKDESNLSLYEEYMKAVSNTTNQTKEEILSKVIDNVVESADKSGSQFPELIGPLRYMLGTPPSSTGATSSTSITTIEQIITLIEAIKAKAVAPVVPTSGGKRTNKIIKFANNKKGYVIQYGGNVEKPRLKLIKAELESAYNNILEITPHIMNILQFLKEKKGELQTSENIPKLITISQFIESSFKKARQNYIKAIPMIFFVIEFTPSIYVKQNEAYYQFNAADENRVSYTLFQNGETYTIPSTLKSRQRTDITKEIWTWKGAHAGFFAQKNNLSTASLVNDPVLGLNTIIAQTSSSAKDKPFSKVKNMMFALGASGTGKTSRYFGLSGNNASEGDKEGIVPSLITSAGSGVTVSFAYFVCYGRTKGDDKSFDETIIFFDTTTLTTSTTEGDYKNYIKVYKMKNDAPVPTAPTVNKYSDFYKNIVDKKLVKVNSDSAISFFKGNELTAGTDGTIETAGTTSGEYTFKQLIESESTELDTKYWNNNKDGSVLKTKFEELLSFQKKLFTVMPTRNNIESSRGHTCVLIRFVKDGTTTYFPLFDMAGTENVEGVKKMIKYGNSEKLAQLLVSINGLSDKLTTDDSSLRAYTSLYDVFTKKKDVETVFGNSPSIDSIIDYEKPSLIIAGGAKLSEIISKFDASITGDIANNLLNKIPREGEYINHTIATMIFASMCVGYSMDSESDTSNSNDKFDDILNSKSISGTVDGITNSMVSKNICMSSGGATCSNTKFLYTDLSYNNILNQSCIWAQVLFTFLYWNDTKTCTETWFNNMCESIVKTEDLKGVDNTKLPYVMEKFDIIKKKSDSSDFKEEELNLINNYTENVLKKLSNLEITYYSDKIIVYGNEFTFTSDKDKTLKTSDELAKSSADTDNVLKEVEFDIKKSDDSDDADPEKIKKIKERLKTYYTNAIFATTDSTRNRHEYYMNTNTDKKDSTEYYKYDTDDKESYKKDAESKINEMVDKLYDNIKKIIINYNKFVNDQSADNISKLLNLFNTSANVDISLKVIQNTIVYSIDSNKKKNLSLIYSASKNTVNFSGGNKGGGEYEMANFLNNFINGSLYTFYLHDGITNAAGQRHVYRLLKTIFNQILNYNENHVSYNLQIEPLLVNIRAAQFKKKWNSTLGTTTTNTTLYNSLMTYDLLSQYFGNDKIIINKKLNKINYNNDSLKKKQNALYAYFKLKDAKSMIYDDIKKSTKTEMDLVKDSLALATKMTLMHLVTGQTSKATMVQDTLDLVETLYDATEVKLNKTTP